ncbi:MAG: hypothetical protein IKK24_05335 [Clostridia bacterium]|nr:hypothetical protein [Clostridia bacterium]
MIKTEIEKLLAKTEVLNKTLTSALKTRADVRDYSHLTYLTEEKGKNVRVWTKALSQAIKDNEIVIIPDNDEPYYIDSTVTIPSNRRIEAGKKAVIRLLSDVKVLMLRNEHTLDGTHAPIKSEVKDKNITIIGGRWEEAHTYRAGYGKSGMYDENRTFYGVSTCMFFNNMENLTLKNLTFANAGGFAIQIGDIKNVVAENIEFCSCFADGLHINGNTENAVVRHLHGQVGDDLLALNMYDWQDSSVNFGPIKNLLAEDLELSADSLYKALRILPGLYYYKDGSTVDCSLNNAVIRGVKGINTFKLYYQTPSYKIADKNPEKGGVGSGDNIYFEDIEIDLDSPVDKLLPYMESDPLRGNMGAFEIGANIDNLNLENIRITFHKDIYPLSYLVTAGPKSVQLDDREVFDPYISCTVNGLNLKNITVNGEKAEDCSALIKEIEFCDLYSDGFSSGKGEIKNINIE